MELLGHVKAYDQHAKPHEFTVYRKTDGYIVQLDGEEFTRTPSHLDAIQAIVDKAAALGWYSRAGA